MRLISCDIENFGKLHNLSVNFEEGLNVKLYENGWGKSTLAAFIRAMFYGLEGDGRHDVIQCERKRFAPWQGGSFGGSMTFEAEGRRYRITRTFRGKVAEDEFELRDVDTNLESHDYTEKIGEELFHINSESFMRTVFIKQNDSSDAHVTDDINAKLGNITDGIDLNRYATANETLKDALNAFSATRKTGEIYRLKSEASAIKGRIQGAGGVEATMKDMEERIHARHEKIEALKKEQLNLGLRKAKAAKLQRKLTLRKTYETLVTELDSKEHTLYERRSVFAGAVPSENNIDEWEASVDAINKTEAVIESNSFSETEASIMRNLSGIFANNPPLEADLEGYVSEANMLNNYRAVSRQYALNPDEEVKMTLYSKAFVSPESAQDEVSELTLKWNERTRLKTEAEAIEKSLDEKQYDYEGESENRKRGGGARAILSLVFLAAAAALYFGKVSLPENLPWDAFAIGCAGIAVLLLLISLFKAVGRRKGDSIVAAELEHLSAGLIETEEKIDEISEEVKEALSLHGYPYEEASVNKALQQLLLEAFDYKALSDRLKMQDEEKEARYNGISARIKSYLEGYGIYAPEAEYPAKLTDLQGKTRHYASLLSKESACRSAVLERERIRSALTEVLNGFGVAPAMNISDRVDSAAEALKAYQVALSMRDDALSRLQNFENENNMDELLMPVTEDENASLDELQALEDELNERLDNEKASLSTDVHTLEKYREMLENLMNDREELKETEGRIEELTKKYGYITKTQELLQAAKENLTAKYMEPLIKGFKKYYGMLTGESPDAFFIDANTVITKVEQGKQRSIETLSDGYRDLIGFCTRLSMADAMYPDTKPMLVLDDPFVNLDDGKMEGAVKLLKEVSKEYQIIYLTCRENRL